MVFNLPPSEYSRNVVNYILRDFWAVNREPLINYGKLLIKKINDLMVDKIIESILLLSMYFYYLLFINI